MNVAEIEVTKLKPVGRFVDAILIAKNLFEEQPQLLNSDKKIINVNPDIVRVINSIIGCDIQILEIKTETTKIAGFLLHRRSEDPENPIFEDKITPQIIVPVTNSTCWKRFAICKELMYYYINGTEEKAWEKALKESTLTHDDLLAKLYSISGDVWEIEKEDELDIERFTVCIATEVLLPWKHRGELKAMKADGQTNRKMAERFKVPEVIIERYFETKYGVLSEECNHALYGD